MKTKRISIVIQVVPSSGRQDVVVNEQGAQAPIRCFLKSAPEDNKANSELIKLLSHTMGIPQREITITRGSRGRLKTVSLPVDIPYEELLKLLTDK